MYLPTYSDLPWSLSIQDTPCGKFSGILIEGGVVISRGNFLILHTAETNHSVLIERGVPILYISLCKVHVAGILLS